MSVTPDDVDVVVMSNDRTKSKALLAKPWAMGRGRFHDGTNYRSFSGLVNDCIRESTYEFVCVASDIVNPEPSIIPALCEKINEGFAIAFGKRFAFTLYDKELIRRIGWLDERFTRGGAEDIDFIMRLKEADIGYWAVDIVGSPRKGGGRWENITAGAHYRHKWDGSNGVRKFSEENYGYGIGPSRGKVKWKKYGEKVGHKLLDTYVSNYTGLSGIVKNCQCQVMT